MSHVSMLLIAGACLFFAISTSHATLRQYEL